MKVLATGLAFAMAIVPAISLASQAEASGARKKRPHMASYRQHFAATTSSYRNPMAANDYSGYYERVLDRVPFGSKVWWRVYDSYPKGR
jgi:hypothetical protein